MQSTNANQEFRALGYQLAIALIAQAQPEKLAELQRRIQQRQQAQALQAKQGATA